MEVVTYTGKAGNHRIEIREITTADGEVVGATMVVDRITRDSIRRVGITLFSVASGKAMLKSTAFRAAGQSETCVLDVDGKEDSPVRSEPEFGPLVYTEADYAPAT